MPSLLFTGARWSEAGVARGLLDEPAVRLRAAVLDGEGICFLPSRCHGGLSCAGSNRHPVVARLRYARRNPVNPGPGEIWESTFLRSVSLGDHRVSAQTLSFFLH